MALRDFGSDMTDLIIDHLRVLQEEHGFSEETAQAILGTALTKIGTFFLELSIAKTHIDLGPEAEAEASVMEYAENSEIN